MYFQEGNELFPADANKKTIYSTTPYLDTWRGMEKCVEQGLARSIGLSNFNSKQVAKVLSVAKVKPVTNQVRLALNRNDKLKEDFIKNRYCIETSNIKLR